MPRDRPDEVKLHLVKPLTREEADDEPDRRSFVNVAALVAVLALVILGFWVFEALNHSRRFQRCLDSGRRNCVDFVIPAK
jgi:hypothetical protein